MPKDVQPYVEQFYELNPATEELLPDSSHLEDGMLVLVESPYHRADLSRQKDWTREELHRARMFNRWAKVTHVSQYAGGKTAFIGVYDDGVPMQIIVDTMNAWIVKRTSIPRKPTEPVQW